MTLMTLMRGHPSPDPTPLSAFGASNFGVPIVVNLRNDHWTTVILQSRPARGRFRRRWKIVLRGSRGTETNAASLIYSGNPEYSILVSNPTVNILCVCHKNHFKSRFSFFWLRSKCYTAFGRGCTHSTLQLSGQSNQPVELIMTVVAT